VSRNHGSDTLPPYRVRFRSQVRERVFEIKAYIDEQRGNDPNDDTGWRVLLEVMHDLTRVQRWPWTGRVIPEMSEAWRQYRLGKTYLLSYYVDEPAHTLYLIDLRHSSQRRLRPGTIRKYKGEIPTE